MNRRKFLGIAGKSIIAAAAAPAIVRAESIMRIKPIITIEDIYDISPLDVPWFIPAGTKTLFLQDSQPKGWRRVGHTEDLGLRLKEVVMENQGMAEGRVQVYEKTEMQLEEMVDTVLAEMHLTPKT